MKRINGPRSSEIFFSLNLDFFFFWCWSPSLLSLRSLTSLSSSLPDLALNISLPLASILSLTDLIPTPTPTPTTKATNSFSVPSALPPLCSLRYYLSPHLLPLCSSSLPIQSSTITVLISSFIILSLQFTITTCKSQQLSFNSSSPWRPSLSLIVRYMNAYSKDLTSQP